MVEFLELSLCEIGEAVDLIVEVLLQLFVAKNNVFLRHVENESVELLLLPPEVIDVLPQVHLVRHLLRRLELPSHPDYAEQTGYDEEDHGSSENYSLCGLG